MPLRIALIHTAQESADLLAVDPAALFSAAAAGADTSRAPLVRSSSAFHGNLARRATHPPRARLKEQADIKGNNDATIEKLSDCINNAVLVPVITCDA